VTNPRARAGFSDVYLIVVAVIWRAPAHTSCGRPEIGLLAQQSSSPKGQKEIPFIAEFLPSGERLFESLLGAHQVPLQLVNCRDVDTYEGSIRYPLVRGLPGLLIELDRAAQIP